MSAGLTSASVELRVEVTNPRMVPVHVTGTSLDIFVDGHFFGEGSTEAVNIPTSDINVLMQTVAVSYANVTPTIIGVPARGGMVTVEIR